MVFESRFLHIKDFFKVTTQNETYYNLPHLSKYAIQLKLLLTSELTVSISEQNLLQEFAHLVLLKLCKEHPRSQKL